MKHHLLAFVLAVSAATASRTHSPLRLDSGKRALFFKTLYCQMRLMQLSLMVIEALEDVYHVAVLSMHRGLWKAVSLRLPRSPILGPSGRSTVLGTQPGALFDLMPAAKPNQAG